MFEEDEDLNLFLADENSPKVPVFKAPQNPSMSPKNTVLRTPKAQNLQRVKTKRKFPGPAGLILQTDSLSTTVLDSSGYEDEDSNGSIIFSSQDPEQDEFLFGDSYYEMLQDHGCQDESDPETLYNKFSILSLKKNSIPGSSKKVPILMLVVKSLDFSSPDPTCSFLDRSGTIKGMIHRYVMEQYGKYISSGSALVLQNVAVLMTARNHYINITVNNIHTIYNSNINNKKLCLSANNKPLESIVRDYSSVLKPSASFKKDEKFGPKRSNPFASPMFIPSPKKSRPSIDDNLLDDLDEESIFGEF